MGDFSEKTKTAYSDRYALLKEFARANRKHPTPCETILWNELRNRKLGINFRRQHPIGDYIADFFSYEEKLVIEIDGKYHDSPLQIEDDRVRQINLERWGYRVLRFTNEEVMMSTAIVLQRIKDAINKH